MNQCEFLGHTAADSAQPMRPNRMRDGERSHDFVSLEL